MTYELHRAAGTWFFLIRARSHRPHEHEGEYVAIGWRKSASAAEEAAKKFIAES